MKLLIIQISFNFKPKPVGYVFVSASSTILPIAYHSRTLRSYEQNYSIMKLKCLSTVDTLN